ncbi:434_t:CDS:2 [Funneliformis caledonium]|uniref:434_t:CDS:1 n=1 Tax=Funneliformis caledonium TaxID=1117310 RepID=A0A9N9F6R2_9GLOM|nr:434_t:CDS:2 [Funneliformis caledonium]
MDKSNKVFYTCSKYRHKNTERGIGLFIPKSTRTRHHKQNDENSSVLDSILSSSSETASILNLSDVCTSSKTSLSLSDRAENLSVDEGYIDEGSTIQDIDDS